MHHWPRTAKLVGLAGAVSLAATLTAPATAATSTSSARKTQTAGLGQDDALSTAALKRLLQAQDLPTTHLIKTTATSHPFNGAAWQNKPINLSKLGYVEQEYTLSGRSNVYDWTPNGDFSTSVLRSGDYTTRLDVRRPKNMKHWSGKVVVEIINMSAGYDWTAIWSALWERVVKDHDIWVGVTSKPNVIPGMQQFDPQRYAGLSWTNPLPADQQACGSLPGDPGYNPNLSKLYENGLAWDMFTQTGRLLKSNSASNPLGARAKQVVLSGESQSANYMLTYYRFFTPSALLTNGKPVYDGYLAETNTGPAGAPINQCATPLATDDAQRAFPDRAVPWAGINSQWDYPGARRWDTRPDANTKAAKHSFWQLAGSNHGWLWQYLYGDANKTDLLKAGFDDPATYDWSCGPNNPEIPLYMSEKALYEQLKRWISTGKAPAQAPRILHSPVDPGNGFDDKTTYDALNNAMGGIRYPMIQVPVASFGIGQYALTGDCTSQIVPFDQATLAALYPSKAYYLKQYKAATQQLLDNGYILKEDVQPLLRTAQQVTSIPTT